jgi:hypothetical protein
VTGDRQGHQVSASSSRNRYASQADTAIVMMPRVVRVPGRDSGAAGSSSSLTVRHHSARHERACRWRHHRQAITRGSYISVRELVATTGALIDGWNAHPWPFALTKDTDEILGNIVHAKTRTSVLPRH